MNLGCPLGRLTQNTLRETVPEIHICLREFETTGRRLNPLYSFRESLGFPQENWAANFKREFCRPERKTFAF